MNTFKQANTTSFNKQEGVNLLIGTESGDLKVSIFVCTIEGSQLKVEFEDHPYFNLDVSVNEAEFTKPTVSYSDDKSFCYVKFGQISVHVKIGDEGVIFDVWDSDDEENGTIDSTYIHYSEINDLDNECEG